MQKPCLMRIVVNLTMHRLERKMNNVDKTQQGAV